MSDARTILDKFLDRYGKPPIQAIEAAGDRAWRSVLAGERPSLEYPASLPSVRRMRWPAVAAAVAAIALAVLVPARVLRSAPAVFEDGTGSRNVQSGEVVRANGRGTLKFSDGARVEMRAESEVSFEGTGEDLRLRVRRGDVLVNATERPTGQLSVETKDISAVGKVFLVNTKDEGSRIAAIAGEARVQQGAKERKLLPGEHVATSPQMEQLSIKGERGWSAQAAAQVALLQTTTASKTPETFLSFEVASIRPHPALNTDGRGRGGGSNLLPSGCAGVATNLDPRRFAMADITAWNLITLAYGETLDLGDGCDNVSALNVISGGPGWIKSDKWDIEAVIPENARLSVQYRPEFGTLVAIPNSADGLRLQKMILTLLQDRLKFVVRREMREVSGYALTAENGPPKLTVSQQPLSGFGSSVDDPVFKQRWERIPSGRAYSEGGTLNGKDIYMADLIRVLAPKLGRPVVDRTGFTGQFSFMLMFNPPLVTNNTWAGRPNIFSAIEKQVGLKLTETKTTMEFWTIERIEKPSEN